MNRKGETSKGIVPLRFENERNDSLSFLARVRAGGFHGGFGFGPV